MIVKGALFLLMAVFGLGIVAFAVLNPNSTRGYNTTAEHFRLPRLNAPGMVSLSELHGRPVVVSLFSSGCAQCPSQLQVVSDEAARQHGRIVFLAVDTRERGNGAEYARRMALAPAVIEASDEGGTSCDGLYEALGGTGVMPLTAFYSADGHIIATRAGPLSSTDMADGVLQLYEQQNSKA